MPKNLIVTKPNTHIEGGTYGRVIVRAPGFKATNVKVVGTGTEKTNVGLFDFTHKDAQGSLIDCTVLPEKPNLWLTGVLGHDFIAKGVQILHTVDGFGIYNTHKAGQVNVTIDDCLVDNLAYFNHDPNHPDKHTHNDAVQIQGGTNIVIRNSTLRAFVTTGDKGPWGSIATGQAVGITPNVSKVAVGMTNNHLNGGAQPLTAIPAKHGASFSAVSNVFGSTSHTGLAAKVHPKVVIASWADNHNTTGIVVRPTVTTDL